MFIHSSSIYSVTGWVPGPGLLRHQRDPGFEWSQSHCQEVAPADSEALLQGRLPGEIDPTTCSCEINMLLCVIQIRSKTWNTDLLILKKKKKLLNVLVMKHGTPGSIGRLLSISLTSQLARLGNQTSLIIINKYSRCSTKVFSFEHHMKRLTDEDSKYCLCRGKILYRARISLRLLSRPYLPWKHTLQKSMRNLKKWVSRT